MEWTRLSWPCQGKALQEPPGWTPPVDVFQRTQISTLWPSSFVAQESASKAASVHASPRRPAGTCNCMSQAYLEGPHA